MPLSLPPWLRPGWTHGLLLVALTAAAYAGVPRAGFVFDDFPLVIYNDGIHELGQAWSYFCQDLWATAGKGEVSGYYRPLMTLSLALDWRLAGDQPMLYHLHSLGWHLLAVWFLHRLLTRLVGAWPALVGASLFALHPVQSEAVVWIAARNDLMATALLLGVLLTLRPRDPSALRLSVGALLAVGAVLAKESTLLLPFFLLTLDLAEWGRLRGWKRHAVLWGAVALHVLARALAGVNAAATPSEEGWLLLWRKLPELAGLVGSLLAWPWPLSVGRDLVSWSLATPALVAGVAFGALALALLAASRQRLVLVGLSWAAMGFLPALLAVAGKGVFGERYLYLPLVGLGLALASALQALPPGHRRWSALGTAVAIAWLGGLHLRVQDWKDDVSLWRSAVRDTPCSHAYASLGHVLVRDGAKAEAAEMYLLALQGERAKLEVCPRLLDLSRELGAIERVVEVSSQAVEQGCVDPVSLGKLASYLAMAGRWEEAVAVASQVEQEDIESRAGLVLAAWDIIEGDCSRYRALREDWTGDMDTQVMRLLSHGGHSELAGSSGAGNWCSPPAEPRQELP